MDSDYDGRTFLVTQAFFPDKSALERLDCALKGYFDEKKFAAFSGTTSLLFMVGTHKRCAVKSTKSHVVDTTFAVRSCWVCHLRPSSEPELMLRYVAPWPGSGRADQQREL